jgi:hypothetical protein
LQRLKTINRNLPHEDAPDISYDVVGNEQRDSFVEQSARLEINSWGLSPGWLLLILVSVPLVASLFWWLGSTFFGSRLTFFEYQQFCVVITGVVAGGYQLYFWAQRNNQHIPAKCMKLAIDDWIPFWPDSIWLYSLLYYFMIGFTVMSIHDLAHGVHLIFGGLMLVATGAIIYYLYPTTVPLSFREFEVNSLSTRYLAFLQTMDNDRNAFPSMHCAVATYVGLTVTGMPIIGMWLGYGFIIMITISCLTVKQHVLVDTVAGVALGATVFFINKWLALII